MWGGGRKGVSQAASGNGGDRLQLVGAAGIEADIACSDVGVLTSTPFAMAEARTAEERAVVRYGLLVTRCVT